MRYMFFLKKPIICQYIIDGVPREEAICCVSLQRDETAFVDENEEFARRWLIRASDAGDEGMKPADIGGSVVDALKRVHAKAFEAALSFCDAKATATGRNFDGESGETNIVLFPKKEG